MCKRMTGVRTVALGLMAMSLNAGEADYGKDYDLDPATFWKLEELSAPPAYRTCPYPDSDWPGLKPLLVTGKGPDGTSAEFFCYYGVPPWKMPEGGWPAVVLAHGGSGTAFPQIASSWVQEGFAVIMPDWYNQRPAAILTNVPPSEISVPRVELSGGKRQDHVANVANLVLAHSLVRSFPEVNKDRTVFAGLSWGSWYGSCVAAVDDRFKGAVEIYCGDRKPKEKLLCDAMGRFHHAMKIPMWWVCWTVDRCVTPESLQDGWLHCPNFCGATIELGLGHGHGGFYLPSVRRMAKHFAGFSLRLPLLRDGKVEKGVAQAQIGHGGKGIDHALLWYTKDSNPDPSMRRWQSVPATVKGKVVSAPVPAGTALCYLTAYEKRDKDPDLAGSTIFMKP